MKTTYNLGDFVCFKNHPYFESNHSIKISANANLTPPIMVVMETLNKDEHDTTTGKKLETQVRCIYYSHKEGKYIDKWFKIDEIKELDKYENTFLKFKNSDENDIYNIEEIEKYDLDENKKKYTGRLVCLKNVDFELNKKKVFLDTTDGQRVNKENNHLDFLPPVMTIIDVTKNKEEKRFSSKNQDIKEKDCSKYLFKCKWYNPVSNNYSEDFFPSSIIGIVNLNNNMIQKVIDEINLDEPVFRIHKLQKEIKLESSEVIVKNSLIKLEDLIFNHYYYNIQFYDFFKRKFSQTELDFSKTQLSDSFRQDEIFENKLPDYLELKRNIEVIDFEKDNYYQIKYIDQLNRSTTRIIKYIEEFEASKKDDENDMNNYILANCLLRDGHLRRFNVSRIYEVRKIKEGQQLFEY